MVRASRILGRDVSLSHLRGMLQEMFPESAPRRGEQWDISTRQASVVEECFRRLCVEIDEAQAIREAGTSVR